MRETNNKYHDYRADNRWLTITARHKIQLEIISTSIGSQYEAHSEKRIST